MIKKTHTRNQRRMYKIHKMEDQIEKDKYIIGNQQQEIERLNNIIDELEKELDLNLKFRVIGVRRLKDKLNKLKGDNK